MLPAATRLMSADDHIIEPPHLWVDRVPAQVPRRLPADRRGRRAAGLARTRASSPTSRWGRADRCPGYDEAGYPPAPGTARFDEIRPGCYDPVERIKDMDIDGVWGQLCFPNYARFAGHRFFLNVEDPELGLACLRTYNDYLLDEWCATDPIAALRRGDPAAARHRRRRGRARPRRRQGRQGDRVLREPDRARSAVGAHRPLGSAVGSRRTRPASRCACTSAARRGCVTTSADAPADRAGDAQRPELDDGRRRLADERDPRALPEAASVILSEGGAGWIPYILERADKAFHDHRLSRTRRSARRRQGRPSHRASCSAEHMYVCLVDEYFALRSLGDIPVDNLLWEGDYPHGDGLWPEQPRVPGEGARRRARCRRRQDRRDQPPRVALRVHGAR